MAEKKAPSRRTKKSSESPVKEVKPAKEVKPVEEAKSVEEVKPVEEAKPVEKAKPVEEAKPAEEAKPVEEAKSLVGKKVKTLLHGVKFVVRKQIDESTVLVGKPGKHKTHLMSIRELVVLD